MWYVVNAPVGSWTVDDLGGSIFDGGIFDPSLFDGNASNWSVQIPATVSWG